MKYILKPIWNYIIGYRNGYYPKILCEHVPCCPLKFWCDVLLFHKKDKEYFIATYFNNIIDEEISYKQYMNEYEKFMELRKKWYNEQYKKNHTKKEKCIHYIHYWLNNIK